MPQIVSCIIHDTEGFPVNYHAVLYWKLAVYFTLDHEYVITYAFWTHVRTNVHRAFVSA